MKWLRIHFLVVRPVPFGSLRFPLSTSRTDMKEVKGRGGDKGWSDRRTEPRK